MKTSSSPSPQGFNVNKINPLWYLAIGVATITLSHMTFSIEVMAWVSSVPFLIYLSLTQGWKSRLTFFLAFVLAWTLVVAKIISEPIPLVLTFLYSIPISLFHLPAYLAWSRFKNQKYALFLFPVIMIIMEWIQYTFTPLASWGVAAYTMHDNVSLIQTVSLFGLAGLSFLIYWVNVSIATIILKRKTAISTFQLPVIMLFLLIVFGSIRYDLSKSNGVDTVTVAAVGTDSEVSGLPLPSKKSNEQNKTALFERTRTAADGGAKIIAWNEAALFIMPEEEQEWIKSIKELAIELNITLVASYVTPISQTPFRYENKYQFIDSSGNITHSYLKHQPVPGEPAVQGTSPLKVIDVTGTKIGAAICYDYDFPYLAKEYGELGADMVILPSSDWRGIDPVHTEMAAFRAVEQGHSVLRSTRFGLSAAITPYGEMASQMSSFDGNKKIMYAQLPAKGVTTLYSIIQDSFVYLSIGFLLFFIVTTIRSKKSAPTIQRS
ncbi:MAG: nitrilase-related carbon-nitrogen hydrolase [Lewinella sp.]|uniref:nitrilase-related carbon-nitrogen hydrolase n=1 Tax=Lewinella sp. TaxID=2004506 RepID=UPI003D6BF905